MSKDSIIDIVRLMTTYTFDVEGLPDCLKCSICNKVLKDACLMPCGCKFCRICIDNMIASDNCFCPGPTEDCGNSSLSKVESDIEANESILKLTVKCPNEQCTHECQLVNMNEHLQECQRKNEEDPCGEMEWSQNKLAPEMPENIKNQTENSESTMEMLNQSEECSKRTIEMLEHELLKKNVQICDLMNIEFSLNTQNKLIEKENKALTKLVKMLVEKITEKNDDVDKIGELDNAKVVKDNDEKIGWVRSLLNSFVNYLSSIKSNTESIKNDTSIMKSQMVLKQILTELGPVDASCRVMINRDIGKKSWGLGEETSDYFSGNVHQYKYQLTSWNGSTTPGWSLWIWLLIYCGPNDEQLTWPFQGQIFITISDMRGHKKSMNLQCRIQRPASDRYSCSKYFLFRHTDLIQAGLNLDRGVHISCKIWPGGI